VNIAGDAGDDGCAEGAPRDETTAVAQQISAALPLRLGHGGCHYVARYVDLVACDMSHYNLRMSRHP